MLLVEYDELIGDGLSARCLVLVTVKIRFYLLALGGEKI